MAFDHLKPPGYALVEVPYDLYCPSVQEKLKGPTGTKYQCQLPECKKIFTTLDLAKRHAMLTQHGKLAMEIVDHDNETHAADQPIDEDLEVLDYDHAPVVIPAKFIRSQFESLQSDSE